MARAIIQGFAEQGGYTVTTDGRVSVTKVQRSFPNCTVDVYLAGTTNHASIFSDVGGTPLANPFTANTDGYWSFWADDGSYDVKFSGGGITAPFSLFNFTVGQSGALNDPGSNGMLARTAPNTVTPRTITGVTNETAVTNGNGSGGNPVIGLATFLEFTGKTLNGGTYLSPGIANFGSAQHSHSDAAGGGQLSASNVFSSGTVPVARLPVMVGATGGSNGTAGLVPQPLIADVANFLRGDGVWATAGGGGGTPGGANTTVQYNNSGTLGGVSGATSDGTNITFGTANLRATSPRFTTELRDANGNAILTLNAVGTAVNNLQLANAAAGGVPTITAIGTDTNISININPKGTGTITTTGNVTLSNNAPELKLIDVNDSKQIRILLSGSNWDFINDTAGTTPLRFDMAGADATLSGNVFLSKASTITIGRPSQTDLTLSNSTGVFTFGQIPVGPASSCTTANQYARKQYIDDQRVRWSVSWSYPVLPAAVETTESVQRWIVPDGQSMFIEDIVVVWAAGSDSGASNVFTIKKRNSSGTVGTDVGTIDVNTPAQNALQVNNISDYALTLGDQIYPLFTTRNTGSEQMVTVCIRGYQNSKTT